MSVHENPRAQDSKKVAIVGVGMVGMSFAYAMLNQNICDELCLIDINKERAEGEAMDLSHGLPFAPSSMKIYSGDYTDCTDMDMIVICAGVPQLEGETRRDLLQKNYKVFKTIVKPIVENGFNGVFLVASNPVDVMTKAVLDLSGFPPERVIGSGTSLDTARLRYMIGDYFKVNPRNIHAYVMGEHGDSEFVAWSSAMISVLPIKELDSHTDQIMNELDEIAVNVRDSAYKIIKAKKATYYGIGMVLARLTRAILNDENSIFTISAYLNGEYSESGFYIGVPALINRNGVRKILEIPLDESEKKRFKDSAKVIKEMLDEIGR
ncbi:l-lactate dehydrogenase [Clostridium sp. CAG:678]|jgi:L-lactate dehydrogenase|nr:l-lactate dehydrogenase [Clostridium sp. CAG:678]